MSGDKVAPSRVRELKLWELVDGVRREWVAPSRVRELKRVLLGFNGTKPARRTLTGA